MERASAERISLDQVLVACFDGLRSQAATLNELDGVAGDGDLGVTITKAAAAVGDALGKEPGDPATVLRLAGAALATAVPSTSGTLLALGFLAAARSVGEADGSPMEQLACGFAAAEQEVRRRGGAALGDKTMLDVLDPVARWLQEAARDLQPLPQALQGAAQIAAAATGATRDLIPQAGRARWLQERSLGHPDAGCWMLTSALSRAAALVDGTEPGQGST